MALVLKDRVLETCTSPGTGTVTLLGAVTGYQSFSTVGNGNTCYYALCDQSGANWEVGIGTYSTAGTLARTTVLSSSNGGNLTNFSTGSQNVFLTYPSERSVNLSSAALTSGRVSFATTDGLLTDSANLTFNGTTLTANTIGAYTLSGTIAGGGNQINNVIIGTSTPLAGSFTTINASTSITNAGLTSGRVTYAGASGLLTDSANLTFDGTNLLLNAANPNVQGTSSTGSITLVNNSGGAFVKVYGGSHATKANYTDFVNASSTSTFDSGGTLSLGSQILLSNNNYIGFKNTSASVAVSIFNDTSNFLNLYNSGNTGTIFYVNAGERLRLTNTSLYTASGVNVGIGTSSPTALLTLSGVAATGYESFLSTGTTTAYNYATISNTGSNLRIGIESATAVGILTGSTNYSACIGTLTANNLHLGTNSTVRATIDSAGNVGIGTSSPANKLSVADNSASAMFYGTQSGAGDLFAVANSASEKFRITNAGNVGIGTTNPSQPLTVNGVIASIGPATALSASSIFMDYNTTSNSGRFAAVGNTTGTAAPIYFSQYSSNASVGRDAVIIDSSGNLLVGTTTPVFNLAGRGLITINGSSSAAVGFTASGVDKGIIAHTGTDMIMSNSVAGAITFQTTNTERMRIDNGGSVLVGATASASDGWISLKNSFVSKSGLSLWGNTTGDTGTQGLQILKYDNDTTTSQVFMRFIVNNGSTASGQINANGASSAAFGSWSDSRLKENVVDLPSQLLNILALRPVEFDYIQTEGGGHQIGFIAQEVNEIYPDLVGQRADGMFTLTDMNKNDARLIKCIQEMHTLITAQSALIESLTTRLTTLENK